MTKDIKQITDKNDRPIRIGDLLKIYHFTDGRRKKYYMYKQVIAKVTKGNISFYKVSHLSMPSDKEQYYYLERDNKRHEEIEIVQSTPNPNFEERIKIKFETRNERH